MSAPAGDLFDGVAASSGGEESDERVVRTVVGLELTYARWMGGDEARGQDVLWRVRLAGVGLIAVIKMPRREVARFKDPIWSELLTDEYLVARLVMSAPNTLRSGRP